MGGVGGEPAAPDCLVHADCLNWHRCEAGQCIAGGPSPLAGSVVVNEVLIDGRIDRDANGDGDIEGAGDAFVELVNPGEEAVPLAGLVIVESDLSTLVRHTFPAEAVIPPGEAYVVFGGGAPSDALIATPGATFAVANAADPAFSLGLHLDTDGDTFRLLDGDLLEVVRFTYGDHCAEIDEACPEAVADRSLTRAPDIDGVWTPHDVAAPGVVISPGTHADGTAFGQ
jgi:hypothetical protein